MNNKIFKYAGYIITVIAFILIGKSLMSMKLDVKYIKNIYLAILLVILLSIGYSLVVFISSFAWKCTLEFINKEKIPYHEIVTVYAKSNIGKYLPGNVMQFVGRNILAGKLGFKQIDITFCSIIEIIMLVITDCVLSLLFAMKSVKIVLKHVYLIIHPSIIYFILIVAILLIVTFIFFIFKKSEIIENYKYLLTKNFIRLLLKLFCFYSLTLIIPGIFLVMILVVVLGANLSLQIGMITMAGYTISWVLGYIVPGAPGGMGVRESVLILILGPIFTSNVVLLAAILLRIASVLGDLIAFLLSPYAFVDKS